MISWRAKKKIFQFFQFILLMFFAIFVSLKKPKRRPSDEEEKRKSQIICVSWWCCDLLFSATPWNQENYCVAGSSWRSTFSSSKSSEKLPKLDALSKRENFSCAVLFFLLCTCKTIFLFLSRICSRKSAICETLPQTFQCRNDSVKGRRKLAGHCKRGEKIGKFSAFKNIWFCIFIWAQWIRRTEKNWCEGKKNLFFFSFRKRKFKCNFFSIKCQLFTNFPL